MLLKIVTFKYRYLIIFFFAFVFYFFFYFSTNTLYYAPLGFILLNIVYARGLGIFLNFNGINKWNTVIIWTIEFFFSTQFLVRKKIFFETKFFELIATSFQFHPSLSRIDETRCLEKSYYYYFFFSFPDLYGIHISFQLREFSIIFYNTIESETDQDDVQISFDHGHDPPLYPSCIHVRRPLLYRSFIANIYEYS